MFFMHYEAAVLHQTRCLHLGLVVQSCDSNMEGSDIQVHFAVSSFQSDKQQVIDRLQPVLFTALNESFIFLCHRKTHAILYFLLHPILNDRPEKAGYYLKARHTAFKIDYGGDMDGCNDGSIGSTNTHFSNTGCSSKKHFYFRCCFSSALHAQQGTWTMLFQFSVCSPALYHMFCL